MMIRLKVVLVYLKGVPYPKAVAAGSFGEAAQQILCGPGQIVRFEWREDSHVQV